MSALPCPPARLLTKNIRRSSFENVGAFSLAEVLITEPRFTGVCQGQRLHARCETQMSFPPCARAKSVRSEWKYRLSPLGESVPWESSPTELIGAPTLTGSDQGDRCAAPRCAVMLGPGGDGRWSEAGGPYRANGSGAAARWRLIDAGVSFTPTPTATNCTLVPYFACAALSDGSSALHSGHQVAQNSSSTGCFPTYCPRSTDFPSRSTTVTAGAWVPRGKPTSCPARATGRASVPTVARANNRIVTRPCPSERSSTPPSRAAPRPRAS